MAVGAMGVGVFTKDYTIVHAAVASTAFLFSGLSAIGLVKVLKKPFSLISIVLGAVTIVALALFLGVRGSWQVDNLLALLRSTALFILVFRVWRNGTHDNLSVTYVACHV